MNRVNAATMAAALLVMACSGGTDTRATEAEADGTPAAMPGSVPDSMPGMNHDSMPGMDHGNMPGMDHDSMQGQGGAGAMNHGNAPATGDAMAGMDHSGMAGGGGAGVQNSMSGMDHSRTSMGEAPPASAGAAGGMAAMDHTPMGDAASAPTPGARPMDHTGMPGMREEVSGTAEAAGRPRDMSGMDHSSMAPALLPADAGTEKLLVLVRRLILDPAVQRQIQEDPALRESWADPGVRRVLTDGS